MQCLSSDSLNGFVSSEFVIKLHAVVITSDSFKILFPLLFDKFDRIFNACDRNGLSAFAQ